MSVQPFGNGRHHAKIIRTIADEGIAIARTPLETQVKEAFSQKEPQALRWSVNRGCPFGGDTGLEFTDRRLDLKTEKES